MRINLKGETLAKKKKKRKKIFLSSLSITHVSASSVKWGHLAHLDPNSTNTIFTTNTMGSSSPL